MHINRVKNVLKALPLVLVLLVMSETVCLLVLHKLGLPEHLT